MKVVALSSSPRPDGNSRAMADALVDGAEEAGHSGEVFDLNEWTSGFLRDCRACRREDGECSIEDRYRDLLFGHVLEADALVYATPLYWYGMAASLKNWFDRTVCYLSASYPDSPTVMDGLSGKRVVLLISSEESYPGSTLGTITQIQEMTRYLDQKLVGIVQGVGNRRGEVALDPNDPLGQARRLGKDLWDRRYTDFNLRTERPGAVWGDPDAPASTYVDA
ncbi:MAG: flavodoxin family protein [Actinomycetota bacterium]|nr:flavodoxin family protein [Actinomycetota bacterium]